MCQYNFFLLELLDKNKHCRFTVYCTVCTVLNMFIKQYHNSSILQQFKVSDFYGNILRSNLLLCDMMNMMIWCSKKFVLSIVLRFKTGVLLDILWKLWYFFQDLLMFIWMNVLKNSIFWTDLFITVKILWNNLYCIKHKYRWLDICLKFKALATL